MTSALPVETLLDAAVLAAGGGFLCALFAAIYAIVRPNPVGMVGPLPNSVARARSWPRGRHYLLLAVLFTAGAIYGSLVPLSFRPLAVQEAVERFKQLPYLSPGIRYRADFVENIVLFVPISYCWLAALVADRRRCRRTMLAAPLVALLCILLSVALEFVQLWFPPRTVSQNDILAETAGTIIGVGLWLVMGQAITDWLRRYSGSASREAQVEWLLEAYCVGLLVYSMIPFDLVFSVAEIAIKFREGKISVLPLAQGKPDLDFFTDMLRHAASFIPVGMLVSRWHTPEDRPVRPLAMSILAGSLAVLAIELARVFVYSRSTAADEAMAGILGVLVGALVMHGWCRHARKIPLRPSVKEPARPAGLWLGLAAAYSLVLFVVFCTPFEPIGNRQQIVARAAGFFRVPFADLYRTMGLEALSNVVEKVLFFVPLGILLALPTRAASGRWPVRLALRALPLLAAIGVGVLIEMAQVFLAGHVPEITDVIVYVAGAAIGMLLAIRMAAG